MALVGAGTALGCLGGWLALQSAAPTPTNEQLQPLVWAVVSTPLLTWLVACLVRRQQIAQALLWCGTIYLASIFSAARLERLLIGNSAALAGGYALYFRLVLALQVVGGLLFAWYWARQPQSQLEGDAATTRRQEVDHAP